jgi:signal transduction histidine kinase
LELRFRRRSEERFNVLVQVTTLEDAAGHVTGWVSSVTDITERKRAEVRVAAEHQITRILTDAQTLDAAAPGILEVLLESLAMEVAELWIFDPDRQVLHSSTSRLRQADLSAVPAASLHHSFVEQGRRLTFALGEGLPGRVWQDRRPVWLTDVALEPGFARPQQATTAGLRSAVAVPIQSAQDFFGVLEFFTTRRVEPDEQLLGMLTAIAGEIAQVLQRRRAEEALRRAHDELEIRVQQRTAQLAAVNDKLQTAITERKRLEHELLDITEKERRRIGLDLHDDLGQKLSGIAMMTKALEQRLAKRRAGEALDASKIHDQVHQAMNHASDLAHDLATLDFKENDLPAALGELAVRAKDLFSIACRCEVQGSIPPLDPNTVRQLYKVAQEAVTNAIKHGKARRVTISLQNNHDQLTLIIHNTGLPFPDLHGRPSGMGLRIMNYRASVIGGSFEIKAAGNRGTQVTCLVPLDPRSVEASKP